MRTWAKLTPDDSRRFPATTYPGRSKCLLTAKSQYLSKILNAQCQHDHSIEAHGNACAVWQAGFQRVEKSIVRNNLVQFTLTSIVVIPRKASAMFCRIHQLPIAIGQLNPIHHQFKSSCGGTIGI